MKVKLSKSLALTRYETRVLPTQSVSSALVFAPQSGSILVFLMGFTSFHCKLQKIICKKSRVLLGAFTEMCNA